MGKEKLKINMLPDHERKKCIGNKVSWLDIEIIKYILEQETKKSHAK